MKEEIWGSIAEFNASYFADVYIGENGRIAYCFPQTSFRHRRGTGYRRRYFRTSGHELVNVDVHKSIEISLGRVIDLVRRHYKIEAMVRFLNEETYVRRTK